MASLVDKVVSRFAQPSEPAAFLLRAGDVFPLDQLVAHDGRPPPAAAPGQRTVIWFYPRDNTPGCTLEGRHFTSLAREFTARNTRVFGCSADDAAAHAHFQESCNIRTDLLTDPGARVGTLLGNARGGRHLRSTIIIDDGNRILRLYPRVAPLGHPEQVLADLG